MRARVTSRRRCRMISWPAAKEIRCVKPSIATVSPSWTSAATASCIVVTLLTPPPPALRGRFDLGDDLLEELERGLRLVLAEHERRAHPNVGVAAPEDQQTLAEGRLLDRGGLIVVGERHADPQGPAAYVGDDRVARGNVAE